MVELLRIYERLRAVLSDEQARVVAEVIAEALAEGLRELFAPFSERLSNVEAELHHASTTLVRVSQLLAEVAALQPHINAALNHFLEAQLRAEERLARLEEALAALAEAQRQFEQRLSYAEEELRLLRQQIEQVERQVVALTEQVTALQQFIKLLERRLELLEQRGDKLERRMDEVVKQLGGITHTIGYTLENAAYKALPRLLARDYGVELVDERIRRTTLRLRDGTVRELNIFARIRHKGADKVLVGESKSQLSRRHITRFVRSLQRLREEFGELFPVIVAHSSAEPDDDVLAHARQYDVAVYFSYDL
jgi:DNA repair exonuclease SbcCD ATPase subunit